MERATAGRRMFGKTCKVHRLGNRRCCKTGVTQGSWCQNGAGSQPAVEDANLLVRGVYFSVLETQSWSD